MLRLELRERLRGALRQLVRIDFCSWASKCRSSTQLVAASFHTCSGSSDRLAERSEDGGRMPDGDGVPRPEPIGDAMWRASRGPAKRESLQTQRSVSQGFVPQLRQRDAESVRVLSARYGGSLLFFPRTLGTGGGHRSRTKA